MADQFSVLITDNLHTEAVTGIGFICRDGSSHLGYRAWIEHIFGVAAEKRSPSCEIFT
jgi:hypothetical protein